MFSIHFALKTSGFKIFLIFSHGLEVLEHTNWIRKSIPELMNKFI